MSTATGRPRPFLTGVFRTACNYCVRSKKGCSGGSPCKRCQKHGKNCVYAQRRMSGPRGRPSGRSQRAHSRAKAQRENRAAAEAVQRTQPAYLESSILVKQRNEDGDGMNVPRQNDNIATGALGGHNGHNLQLLIPQEYYHSMESTSCGWHSSSIQARNESLASIYSSDDGEYPPSDGDRTHTIGKNEGNEEPGLILEGPSGDIMNIATMDIFPNRGTCFSSGGGNSIDGCSIGVACHDGIQDIFGTNTVGEASSKRNDRFIPSAPLVKEHSSLPSIFGNSLGGDDANDKYDVTGCWAEQSPLNSVKDTVDPRKPEFAKSSSTGNMSLHPVPNGSCTQCLDSTSPISEVPRQLTREVTPTGAPLGVIPTPSQDGGLNLQSPGAIDDLLLVDCFSNWTEQNSIQLEREQSADLYLGGGIFFPGRVSGGRTQDLSYHHQKQQQQQQRNTSHELFLWKDVDALDKAAVATAAATANADSSHIQIFPPPRINIGQPLIDPPLDKGLLSEVISSVFLPSSTGGADISPATLGRRSTDNHFTDALSYLRAKVPRREIGLKIHVTSPIISGGTVDEGDVDTVLKQVNATASPPIYIESAILMDLDRSMKVAAGTELHDEFVDLDCAIMPDMQTPLAREAPIIRGMHAASSEVVVGANSSTNVPAFASLW